MPKSPETLPSKMTKNNYLLRLEQIRDNTKKSVEILNSSRDSLQANEYTAALDDLYHQEEHKEQLLKAEYRKEYKVPEKLWHGSSVKFSSFDINQVLSNSGESLFGHGLNFTDSKEEAELLAKKAALGKAEIRQITFGSTPVTDEYINDFIAGKIIFYYLEHNRLPSNNELVTMIQEEDTFIHKPKQEELLQKLGDQEINYIADIPKAYVYEVTLNKDAGSDLQLLSFSENLEKQNLLPIITYLDNLKLGSTPNLLSLDNEQIEKIRSISNENINKTFFNYYLSLSELLGGEKFASSFLNKAGYDGIYVDQANDKNAGDYYILFNNDNVTINEVIAV